MTLATQKQDDASGHTWQGPAVASKDDCSDTDDRENAVSPSTTRQYYFTFSVTYDHQFNDWKLKKVI